MMGFHEGIGDTLALSVTPKYLHQQGILADASEHPEAILNQQLRMGAREARLPPLWAPRRSMEVACVLWGGKTEPIY